MSDVGQFLISFFFQASIASLIWLFLFLLSIDRLLRCWKSGTNSAVFVLWPKTSRVGVPELTPKPCEKCEIQPSFTMPFVEIGTTTEWLLLASFEISRRTERFAKSRHILLIFRRFHPPIPSHLVFSFLLAFCRLPKKKNLLSFLRVQNLPLRTDLSKDIQTR